MQKMDFWRTVNCRGALYEHSSSVLLLKRFYMYIIIIIRESKVFLIDAL